MMSLILWIVPFLGRVSSVPSQAGREARPESKRGEHFEVAAYEELARHGDVVGSAFALKDSDSN